MFTSVVLAVAVTAGIAAGVFIDPESLAPVRWAAAMFGLLAFVAGARQRFSAKLCIGAVVGAACVLLGAGAQARAMHPPLRQLLEDRLGGFALEEIDATRHDDPVEIEGWLMADATPSESGATLRVQVERASIGSCPEPAAGGVSLTVSGVMAAEAIDDWRSEDDSHDGGTATTGAIPERWCPRLRTDAGEARRLAGRNGEERSAGARGFEGDVGR
jgi:hypothetical protein